MDWTHGLTALGGVIATVLSGFFLYRVNMKNAVVAERRQMSDEQRQETEQLKALFEAGNKDRQMQGLRITEVEKRHDLLELEHRKCIEVQANLKAKSEYQDKEILMLKASSESGMQNKTIEMLGAMVTKLDAIAAWTKTREEVIHQNVMDTIGKPQVFTQPKESP